MIQNHLWTYQKEVQFHMVLMVSISYRGLSRNQDILSGDIIWLKGSKLVFLVDELFENNSSYIFIKAFSPQNNILQINMI